MRMSSIWGRGHILIVLVAKKKNGGNLRMKGILKLVIGGMLIQSFVTCLSAGFELCCGSWWRKQESYPINIHYSAINFLIKIKKNGKPFLVAIMTEKSVSAIKRAGKQNTCNCFSPFTLLLVIIFKVKNDNNHLVFLVMAVLWETCTVI